MWPIWLLDIDGVINASPYRTPTYLWPADQWTQGVVRGGTRDWPITVATPVLDFINHVHNHKWAEVVWLTTWQKDANNVSDVMGLPRLRVLENPMTDGTRYHDSNKWWKLSEALTQIATGRPVIWTDDDLSRRVKDLARGAGLPDQHLLLLSPNSDEGLAPKHLGMIADFIGMPYE